MAPNCVLTMANLACLHINSSTPQIPIHGTRLVLCPLCWAAIDPARGTVRAPTRKSALVEPATPSAEPGVKLPLPKPLTLMTAAELPDEFGIPLSKPRFKFPLGILHDKRVFLTLVVAFPIALFSTWFLLLHYPRFERYTDPTQSYSIEFPVTPMWFGGKPGGGADGEAERSSVLISEGYRVQVTPLRDSRFNGLAHLNSRALAIAIKYSSVPVIVRSKPDVEGTSAAAQYEQWFSVRHVVVGQVVIANDFVYEMTVSGQSLSLNDSRVQRFFDSFQRN